MRLIVSLFPSGRRLPADIGELLSDVLVREGIPLNLYCGRRGVCGKCFVEVLSGEVPPDDESERALAREKNLGPGRHRLACRLRVQGDLVVRVPEQALIPKVRILTRGWGREIPLDPTVRKVAVRPVRPDLQSPHALLDGLKAGLGLSTFRIAPEALFEAAGVLSEARESDSPVTAVLGAGDELRGVERGNTSSRLFGLAVDLGTTTLAADLVDLGTGAVVKTAGGWNGQSVFGADVVSRITAAFKDMSRAAALRAAVLASINGLILELSRESGVDPGEIYETVVAGNTAMSHLFLGLPVDGLAVAPFAGVFTAAPPLPADRTGLKINPLGRVYLSPNLQSFVGGDVAAGLVATDLAARPGNVLFVDLGTNGELVLKTDRTMMSTSTAAGPAFEGASISCGLPAEDGAVERAVLRDDGTIVLETIGGGPARGVCGTGLVDLIAAFLRRGDLAPDGRILRLEKRLAAAPELFLTASDIREFQLAAAAVKTGIRMLMDAAALNIEDLNEILVAGAFGARLDVENAAAVGLLPRLPGDRVKFVGNTSLEGARALLLSSRERLRAESLPRVIRHLPLAQNEAFQNIFIKELPFRPWPPDEAPEAPRKEDS